MPSITLLVACLGAAYFATFFVRLGRNYLIARKTRLPIVIVPWDQNHFLWMAASVPLMPHLRKWLPSAIINRLALTTYGFEFHERDRIYRCYTGGERSYMHVGMGKLEMNTSDPEIVYEILRRPKDFQVHELTSLFMERFGHNVLTSDGERWARHRKIVASVINERVSKAVFSESIQQAEGLVQEVMGGKEEARTGRMFDMMKQITINVLSGATMGQSVPFSESDQKGKKVREGYRMNYIESVKVLVDSVAGPIILPQWFLRNYPSFLPGHAFLRKLSYAIDEFPIHTNELLEEERARTASSKEGETRGNVMSQLLAASEASEKSAGLTSDEMMGNLFIFTIAGFDTTANTLSYSLALLARHQNWQDWVREEIDRILPPSATVEELDYSEIYPQATRIMAFMFETLRLFPPLIHISKQTRTAQTIRTSKGEYWLPADMTIYSNTIGLHSDPNYWRNLNLQPGEIAAEDDEWRFRPTRWFNPEGSAQVLYQPPKGVFVPWSAGPRVCPGQKVSCCMKAGAEEHELTWSLQMAQVEFTSVILTLLRRCRLEPAPLDGESIEQTHRRLEARMRDSISILTLQMAGVYDVKDEAGGLPLRLVARR